jgi:hypothetical protein
VLCADAGAPELRHLASTIRTLRCRPPSALGTRMTRRHELGDDRSLEQVLKRAALLLGQANEERFLGRHLQ